MPTVYQPGSGHIDQALSDLVVKHPTAVRFIADEICNVIPVQKESDKFWKVQDAHLIDQSARTRKAPGGESNKVDLDWTTDSYATEEQALSGDLPHRSRDNADDALQLELETAALARAGVLLAKEKRAAEILFSTTYVTNNTSTAARWDDSTPSNIKAWNDILGAKRKVRQLGGVDPTHIAMGDVTWTSLAKYILSQSGTPAGVRWMGIAEVLRENPDSAPESIVGLRLLVGTAVYSTAKKGSDVSRASSGGNISDIWADQALVFHKGRPGLKTVQLAARFMKSGWPRVRTGTYADTRAADWYEYAENESGVKVIAASCGFLITNTET